jgi:hypothetical protein
MGVTSIVLSLDEMLKHYEVVYLSRLAHTRALSCDLTLTIQAEALLSKHHSLTEDISVRAYHISDWQHIS